MLPSKKVIQKFVSALKQEDQVLLANLFVEHPELIGCVVLPERDKEIAQLAIAIREEKARIATMEAQLTAMQNNTLITKAIHQAVQQAFRVMAGNKFQVSEVPLWTLINDDRRKEE